MCTVILYFRLGPGRIDLISFLRLVFQLLVYLSYQYPFMLHI